MTRPAIFTIVGTIALLGPITTQAANPFVDLALGGQIGTEQFHWTDLDRNNVVIGKESGSRTSLGISLTNEYRRNSGIIVGFAFNFAKGDTSYAGDAWSGVVVPLAQVATTQASSDSSLIGFDFLGGYRFVSGNAGYILFGGIHRDSWRREIGTGVSTTGNPTYPHSEYLDVTSLRIGAGTDYTFSRLRIALAMGPYFANGERQVNLMAPTSNDTFTVDANFINAYFASLTSSLNLDETGYHGIVLGIHWNQFRSKAARDVYVSERGTAYRQPGTELATLSLRLGYKYRF